MNSQKEMLSKILNTDLPKNIKLISPQISEGDSLIQKSEHFKHPEPQQLKFAQWVPKHLVNGVKSAFISNSEEFETTIFQPQKFSPLQNTEFKESLGSSHSNSSPSLPDQDQPVHEQNESLVESFGCSSERSFDAATGKIPNKNENAINFQNFVYVSKEIDLYKKFQFELDLKTAKLEYRLEEKLEKLWGIKLEKEILKKLKPKLNKIILIQMKKTVSRNHLRKTLLVEIKDKEHACIYYKCYQALCRVLEC